MVFFQLCPFPPGRFSPFPQPPPIRSPFQKVGRVSHWPHIQSVGLEEFSQRGDNFAKMMVENASVYSERNLPTSCPLIRIFCSRISLRNNIPIEKTCHHGNGAISLDFWYGECQKWIQICIWAPGPIFIPGFLHRSPAPVWMELELHSLNIECQMVLNAQRRCWSPKGTCYSFTNKRPLPRNKFLRTFHYCQPRHVQVWQGWFWQDWRCKPRRKRNGTRSLRTLARSCSMTPWHGRHHQDYYIFSGTGILGLGNRSKGYPATEQLEKNGPATKYMDLVEKPNLLGQKFAGISARRWGFPRKNSVDRPLIPRQIMGTERNTSGVPFASCFFFQKKYGRSWVNCRTWVNFRLSMTCPVS